MKLLWLALSPLVGCAPYATPVSPHVGPIPCSVIVDGHVVDGPPLQKLPENDGEYCVATAEASVPKKAESDGVVQLHLRIDAAGALHRVRVLSAPQPLLDEVAVRTVSDSRACKFRPALLEDGSPSACVEFDYSFAFHRPTTASTQGECTVFGPVGRIVSGPPLKSAPIIDSMACANSVVGPKAGRESTVRLKVRLDAAGTVESAEPLKGPSPFADAAVRALKESPACRFSPGVLQSGERAPCVELEYVFHFE